MMRESERSLSVSQARRVTLASQGFLDTADKRGVNRRDLRRMMGRIKLLQLDSVPAVVRAQYLPAFSRLGPYPAELLDDIAYAKDHWFETWSHEASLMPVEQEPQLRWLKARSEAGGIWKSLLEFSRTNQDYIESVLAEVHDRGPLLASQLSEQRPRVESGWGATSSGAMAFDWLFRIGRLGIRRVGNFEKQFDLLENIVPPEVRAQPTPPVQDALKDLLVLSAEAFGVGTANDLVDYFRLPPREAKPLLVELVEERRLIPVSVRGWSPPAFMAPGLSIPRKVPRRALVSPFDPVVWFRDRGERLFNFRYRIEIYVPAAKRVYGYYVLPFLLGEHIAARVDVKTDRKDRVLRVPGAFLEGGHDGPHDVNEVAAELAAELIDLARFVGVDDVIVGDRGDLAAPLRHAVASHRR